MKKYKYRDGWAMKDKTVYADKVEFAPEHVVFRDRWDNIIVAVQNTYVNNLIIAEEDNDDR